MVGSKPGPPERRKRVYTTQAAKARFIELIRDGLTIVAALEKVGRARKTYEEWRRTDAEFKASVDQAKMLHGKRAVTRGERMDFAAWRMKYLRVETPFHQMQWVDLLEGREPRDLHPSQQYTPGKRNRLLINCPPFHGKTVALTIDYVTYRLCLDPGFRVLLISAGQDLAKDFLFGIKQRLTSPDFLDLQLAYAPDGGWESTAESWTESKIVFGAHVRAGSTKAFHEKDANAQALGIRSKVYGRRADLAIIDDGVDTTNVAEYAKQMKWLRSMVESRLEGGGKLLVVGTRVSPLDLYSELLKPENYANGVSPWTYLASPAIMEEAADPKDHKTLWPWAQAPWVHPDDSEMDECLCESTETCTAGQLIDGSRRFARWDGVHLEKGPRASNSAADWALIYQQRSVSEDATFPEHKVTRATNNLRLAGLLMNDRAGHPLTGMHGKYVLAGLDPSIKGFAGIVVVAVDKETEKRYLLNAFNIKAPTKDQLVEKMQEVTLHYGVAEWRVEKTGLLQFFTQDSVMRQWFNTRGVRFTEHHTGSNKWDASFGVSSLASLFGDATKSGDQWEWINEPLLELPRPNTDGVKALVFQLVTWTPDLDPNKVPCDIVMALWFAEIGAREHLGHGQLDTLSLFRRSSKFVSPRRNSKPQTVRLADYRRA